MISFKNENSDGLSLLIKDHGRRQRAVEKIEMFDIPGRSGKVIDHTEDFETYQRTVTLFLTDLELTNMVYKWLRGNGKLRTSLDSGYYFKASVVSMIDSNEFSKGINELGVTFEINPPFAYHESGLDPIEIITSPTKIINPGTRYAEPIYTIFGNGNITLEINGKYLPITGVVGYIVIDLETKQIYKDTLNQGKKVNGKLEDLYLIPGENTIAWTGTITKIKIIPNWRDY